MIKTNFTITFFESEICFKINAKFILITNTHPVTFLDLRFLVVLKTQAKKVLSAGIFNGCLRFFLPDEEHYCRMNDHPVECVLHPSLYNLTGNTKVNKNFSMVHSSLQNSNIFSSIYSYLNLIKSYNLKCDQKCFQNPQFL